MGYWKWYGDFFGRGNVRDWESVLLFRVMYCLE